MVYDGKLYLAFMESVMEDFLDDYEILSKKAEGRWLDYYGTSEKAPTGPFNTECMATGYLTNPTRTCAFLPQKLAGVEMTVVLDKVCVDQLNTTCGDYRGDDPVNGGACSTCLTEHYEHLTTVCPAAYDGTLQNKVDKSFCW